MIVKIYQIKDSKFETCKYVFRDYDFAKYHFSINDYDEVYSYVVFRKVGIENDYSILMNDEEKEALLDEIYYKFNNKRPDDFYGHSLSVSDIVALDNEIYYCDSFGWEKIC